MEICDKFQEFLWLFGIIWNGAHSSVILARFSRLIELVMCNEWGELTTSYRWTGWVWDIRIEAQDFMKITEHFREICRMCLKSMKIKWKITTCNWLDMEIHRDLDRLFSLKISPRTLVMCCRSCWTYGRTRRHGGGTMRRRRETWSTRPTRRCPRTCGALAAATTKVEHPTSTSSRGSPSGNTKSSWPTTSKRLQSKNTILLSISFKTWWFSSFDARLKRSCASVCERLRKEFLVGNLNRAFTI